MFVSSRVLLVSGVGVDTFRVRYQTLEFRGMDLHVRSLRDRNQFADPAGAAAAAGISSASWPLFGVLWDSGIVLADLMLDQPVEDLRILEVGCGLALSSLVLGLRGANVTATDQHPEAASFLRSNIALNSAPPIPFHRIDWTEPSRKIGTFDIIIGSDVLYERGHAAALSGLVERHAAPHGQVVVADPGRSHVGRFVRQMAGCGWSADRCQAPSTAPVDGRKTGHVVRFDR